MAAFIFAQNAKIVDGWLLELIIKSIETNALKEQRNGERGIRRGVENQRVDGIRKIPKAA